MLAVEVGFDLTVAKYKRSAKKQQINHYMAGVSLNKSLSSDSGVAANRYVLF